MPSIAVLNPRKALHEEARLLLEGPALSWSPRRVEVEAFVLSDNYIEGHVFDITQYTIERLCPPRSVRTRIKCPAVRVDCCVHEPKPAQLGHAASAQKMVMTSAKKCRPTFFPPSHSLSDRHRVPFSIGCTHIRTHSFIRALLAHGSGRPAHTNNHTAYRKGIAEFQSAVSVRSELLLPQTVLYLSARTHHPFIPILANERRCLLHGTSCPSLC